MTIVGEAFVKLRADDSNFEKDAEGKVTGAVKKIALAAGGVFAAQKIFDFGADAYRAAAESEKIARQTEAVIKSTGGAAGVTAEQVGKMAEALSRKTAVDDEAIQSGTNLLLTFTNIRDGAGKGNDILTQSTAIMTDMAAALGTDVSAGAVQLGKALNDPIKGVSALSRVGVTFTEDQKKVIARLVETGDTAGAQRIILAELNKEFGGSAAAQATAADRLKLTMGNLQEEIGARLIPVVEALSGWFADKLPVAFDMVGRAFGALKPFIDTIKTGFQAFFGAVKEGDVTSDGFVGTMETVGDAIHRLAPVIQDLIKNGIEFLGNAWETWGPVITAVVTTIVNAIVQFGLTAVNTVLWIVENWNKIEPLAVAIATVIAAVLIPQWIAMGVNAVRSAAQNVAAWVTIHAQAIASTVISSAQMVINVGQWVWMGIQAGINAAVVVAGWVATAAAAVANTVVAVAQFGIQVAQWVWLGVQSTLHAAKVAAAWLIAMGPIGLLVAAVIGAVVLIVANWEKVSAAAGAVWEFVKEKFDALVGFVGGLPARIGAMASGMWDGIKNAFKSALNWVIEKWNSLEFKIPGFKVGPVGFEGFTLGVPDIPKFHSGGVVPGNPGQEFLALLRGGEVVLPPGGAAGGAVMVAPTIQISQTFGPGTNADDVRAAMAEVAQQEVQMSMERVVERALAGVGRI